MIKRNEIFGEGKPATSFWKVIINTILSSDFDFTKLKNFTMMTDCDTYRRIIKNPQGKNKEKYVWKRGMLKNSKYLSAEQKIELINYFENERTKKNN